MSYKLLYAISQRQDSKMVSIALMKIIKDFKIYLFLARNPRPLRTAGQGYVTRVQASDLVLAQVWKALG